MKKIFGCILCICILVGLAGCSGGNSQSETESESVESVQDEKNEELSIETILNDASFMMLNGGAKAEDAYNLVRAVWHDAIFEESNTETILYVWDSESSSYFDFSKAIKNLYMDEEFSENIEFLKECMDVTENLFKNMKNVPEQYKECYSTLTEMYKDFTSMLSMVINPTGSYQDYTEKFMEHDSNLIQNYNLVKTQLPEVESSEDETGK